MTSTEYEEIIVQHLHKISNKIYPFLGLGAAVKEIIDLIATNQFGELINDFPNSISDISILSVEGRRDGISGTEIQNEKYEKENSKIFLALDPIDGTLSCSRGGTRGVSVIGLAENNENKKYKIIPDEFSCLSIGSNIEKDFLEHLNIYNMRIGKDCFKNDFENKKISFINREDTFELLFEMLRMDYKNFIETYNIEIGDNSGYTRNLCIQDNIFVGDSTITLPLESDYFIGRVGISEARLESFLWKYWKGLLVSSKRMKKYPGGTKKYIIDRICSINNLDININDFFENEEIELLHKYGWTDYEIRNFLNTDNFTPDYKFILISSLVGTLDGQLSFKPHNWLAPLKYDIKSNSIILEYWIIENKEIRKKIISNKIVYFEKWFECLNWTHYLKHNRFPIENEKEFVKYMADLEQGKGDKTKWSLKTIQKIITSTKLL